jgi:hypothetical protein
VRGGAGGRPWKAGGRWAFALVVLVVLVVDELAAPATAEAPRASATSAVITSASRLVKRNMGSFLSLVRLSRVQAHSLRTPYKGVIESF